MNPVVSGDGAQISGTKGCLQKDNPSTPQPQPPSVPALPQAWKQLGAAIAEPTFRRTVERVHALGPRALGELLIELEADPDTLARYARLTPTMLHATGGNRWPTSIFAVGAST